jgi:hypothetical protein
VAEEARAVHPEDQVAPAWQAMVEVTEVQPAQFHGQVLVVAVAPLLS